MRLFSQGCSLVSQKSWFCFDDEVVALGTGITAHDGRRVETVVENRRLATGTEAVLVDGTAAVPSLGETATTPGARWVHLAGTGGYVFPDDVEAHLKRGWAAGPTSASTRPGPTTPRSPVTTPPSGSTTAWTRSRRPTPTSAAYRRR
jgi:hyaluronate lyase